MKKGLEAGLKRAKKASGAFRDPKTTFGVFGKIEEGFSAPTTSHGRRGALGLL
jgi:hypothetical protein